MRQLRSSLLVPPGFIVEHAERDRAEVQLTLRHRAESSPCPGCGTAARQIHSHYQRLLGDLPMAGWTVRLRLQARRFRCDAVGCRRRVFTERFAPDVLAPWARRTGRLDELVHHLAIALGGRPASRLARRLMLPVGKDALLRVVRRVVARGWFRRQSSASTTGPGAATSATGPSSAIWNGAGPSPCCPTASRRRREPGSRPSRRSPSWPVIAAVGMPLPQPRPCRRQSRSPTAGT